MSPLDGAGLEVHVWMKLDHWATGSGQEAIGPAGRLRELFLIRVDPTTVAGRELQVPT